MNFEYQQDDDSSEEVKLLSTFCRVIMALGGWWDDAPGLGRTSKVWNDVGQNASETSGGKFHVCKFILNQKKKFDSADHFSTLDKMRQ